MTTTFIGVDPGKDGGFAAIVPTATGPCIYDAMKMPLSGNEIDAVTLADIVKIHRSRSGGAVAIVERVGAMPKQGLSSTFNFGKGYGLVLGVFAALGVRVELVTPQRWKGLILAGTLKDKNAAIAYCRRAWSGANLIPQGCRVPHDGIADAICIAAFGHQTFGGITSDPILA
jgi:crossover junction endodeoxyribonuclease RuvC